MVSGPEKNGLDKTQSFKVITHGMTVSHYRMERKIGAGGMGEVFLAQDTRLNRNVALKFLSPEYTSDPAVKSRFMREAQAAAALSHPNIITVYEVAEHQNRSYIVMEYVEGESLKELITKRDLRISELIDIAMQISQGLAKAHEAEIIHRDIKPQNVLIDKDGRARIVDFGLAKLKGDVKITQSGSGLGTVSYLSPEQAQGEQVDRRSDIFSLGVMLYEMITGRLPFQGEHQAAILNSIVNEQPQPSARYNNRVSQELQRIVTKTLSKDKAERYQHADDLLADLRRERKVSEQMRSSELSVAGVAPRSRRRLLSYLVPASVVFVIAFVVLILRPFRFDIAPEDAAVAEQSSLAVMYFDNLVDPEDSDRLAQMITSLLITDLSESQYVMRVVSQQRLYDILKLVGQENLTRVDKTVASEVAREAKVKWILTGDILQTEPRIVLTSDISDAATGAILATQRVTGEEGEDFFSVVDKLTEQIKEDLSLSGEGQRGLDRAVADVTTHSPEAYRHYLEGVEQHQKAYLPEAIASFKKALEFDSTFAMAYYKLALVDESPERKAFAAKALEYSDRVSQKERQYIEALHAGLFGNEEKMERGLKMITERFPQDKSAFELLAYHYYGKRRYEEAVQHLNKVLEMDPLHKLSYNMLAYTYHHLGDFDKSIWAINKYISIAPEEANPYDTRGDLYAWNGKIDQAIESYQRALEKKPDFFASRVNLGHMYLFKGEYARAESCYKELSSSTDRDTRSLGRSYLANILAYRGKLTEALEVLDDGIAADRMERAEGRTHANKYFLKAVLYDQKGDLDAALRETERCVEVLHLADPISPVYARNHLVWVLSRKGDVEKAEQLVEALGNDIQGKDAAYQGLYLHARGCLDLAKGNPEAAVADLEKADQIIDEFYVRYLLCKTYLEAGKVGEAVTSLEDMLSKYTAGRAGIAPWAVKAHYLLGLAYEKSGWTSKAVDKYEEFLDIWKDADPGIPEVEDARDRLVRLKSKA
jgi:serine/threonine protein kinase/tetratricopeptide (TPR) repeat protein